MRRQTIMHLPSFFRLTASVLRGTLGARSAVGLAAVVALAGGCQLRQPPTLAATALPITSPGWIRLRPESGVAPGDFFARHAQELGLAPGTEMLGTREQTDELGMMHLRFQQRWRGLDVDGAEFLLHARDGRLLLANGRLAIDFAPTESAPAIGEAQAWEAARRALPAERFYDARRLQASVAEGPTTTAPPGRLLYAATPDPEPRWVLAWRFDAYAAPMEASRRIDVDAVSGTVVNVQPLMPGCFATTNATTFRGSQPFNTVQRGGRFLLADDCHGNELRYRDLDASGTKVQDLVDADNNWADQDVAKVTSFWALGIAYDYFDLVHGRKGHDGANGTITIVNNPGLGDGANGGGGFINIGLGSTASPADDYNTVDIVGHEFVHNLIENSAALGYDTTKESAALNESFSDIFGVMVDAWEKRTQSPNWIIGGDKGCVAPAVCRNLINPKQFGHPDTYQGLNWQASAPIDPHVNGTVQNRWFALLASGGSGTNPETSQAFTVNGIGIEKARRIAYRSLTRYLTSGSGYIAARDGSIQAAIDLFGDGSTEEGAVTQAWCAVNLCPWTVPGSRDRFDRPGGNPNPASPDHNDTEAGATPTGAMQWVSLGLRRPRLSIRDLNLFPAGDVDHFLITVPEAAALGGACFPKGVALTFTAPVDARILVDGVTVRRAHDTRYLKVPASGSFVLRVSAPFPGLVLDYAIRATFFQSVDPRCWQTEPPTVFERVRDCPMCDLRVLGRFDSILLDPDDRQPDGLAPLAHLFDFRGGALSLPIEVQQGRVLKVDLVEPGGRTLRSLNWSGGESPVLRAELPAGVYGLRFSGYGNGTAVRVQAPGGR
jgi:Zn-dependent metalloprotease